MEDNMGEENKTFVESKFIKAVNEAAEKAYKLKADGNSKYKTEQNKLSALIVGNASKYMPKTADEDKYIGCACDVFIYCLRKWTPGNRGFWGFYKNTFTKRVNDIYSDKKADKQISIDDSDEDNPICEIPDDLNLAEDVQQPDAIKHNFDILNNIVIGQKKRYENSPKICYTQYFYSEFVTERIHKEKNPSVFKKAEEGLMKAIDHDFISFYMNGKNNSIEEISVGSLKKLSIFSEDPKDDKPCGYQIQNIVYSKYVSQTRNQSKLQSGSSITQQRNKFMELIQSEFVKRTYND